MRYIVALLLVFIFFNANAQVRLVSLNELEQRMAKGRDTTYVVNFWATWCAPCVKELPYFEQVNTSYKDQPIKVLLVSLDFKSKLQSQVIPFVKRHKLESEVFVINEPDQQAFFEKVNKKWSGGLPATWFINTKNRAAAFYEREFAYNDLTSTLFNLK